MPRVVPSEIVRYIEATVPKLADEPRGHFLALESGHAPFVAGLVDMLRALPPELLALIEPGEYTAFVASQSALKAALNNWSFGTHQAWQARVTIFPAFNRHPVAIIRSVLLTCPDEAPALTTSEFSFLGDPDLEADLRLDLSHAFAELGDREFKSATVLAGSVVETLLYWAVSQKKPGDITAAITAVNKPKLDPALKGWGLDDFLKVAQHLRIISDQTAKAADAARDYRNLIHPERAARHGRTCDQATAMSAVAGVLHVATDLEGWVKGGKP
jgi:hypothetical protein